MNTNEETKSAVNEKEQETEESLAEKVKDTIQRIPMKEIAYVGLGSIALISLIFSGVGEDKKDESSG